jgi:hypothetical protein
MLQSHYYLLPPSGAAAPAGKVIVRKMWNGKEMAASKANGPTHTLPPRAVLRAGKAARGGGTGGESWRALVRHADTQEAEAKTKATTKVTLSQLKCPLYSDFVEENYLDNDF